MERNFVQPAAPQTEDELEKYAMAVWGDLAAEIGWDAKLSTVRSLKRVCNSQMVSAVSQISCPGRQPVVLKMQLLPWKPEEFAHNLENLSLAQQILANQDCFHVPKVHWADMERCIFIQDFVPGDHGRRALRRAQLGTGNRAEILRRMGQYAAALHRGSAQDARPFPAYWYLREVAEAEEQVRQGVIEVPHRIRFLELCAYLHRAARRCDGMEVPLCRIHGDFHLLNLVISDDSVTALDFSCLPLSYGYRDIARFWLFSGNAFDPEHGASLGFAGLPREDLSAFEKGYGHAIHSDPACVFFFALVLFREWRRPVSERQGRADLQRLDRFSRRFDALLNAEASD